MRYITVEDAISFHEEVICRVGGCSGIRDLSLLLSAIEMPKCTMFGEELHPSVYDKAAAYLFHIIQNHPFVDGNKRTATLVMLTFLRLNGIILTYDEDEFLEYIVQIASGKLNKKVISSTLQHWHLESEIVGWL